MSLVDEINVAISAPALSHNVRAQVCAALRRLPPGLQKIIAIEFALHAIDQLLGNYETKRSVFFPAVHAIRDFIQGKGSIERVSSLCNCAESLDRIRVARDDGSLSIRSGPAGEVLVSAELFCCLHELKASKLIVWTSRQELDICDFAKAAALAVQRKLHSHDYTAPKKAGLLRAESEWQLQNILSIVKEAETARKE